MSKRDGDKPVKRVSVKSIDEGDLEPDGFVPLELDLTEGFETDPGLSREGPDTDPFAHLRPAEDKIELPEAAERSESARLGPLGVSELDEDLAAALNTVDAAMAPLPGAAPPGEEPEPQSVQWVDAINVDDKELEALLNSMQVVTQRPAKPRVGGRTPPEGPKRAPKAKARGQSPPSAATQPARAEGRPKIRGMSADEAAILAREREREKLRELEKRLEDAKLEKESFQKRLGQVQAETVSYRKRLEAQAEAARMEGREQVFRALLPMMDSLDAALASTRRSQDFKSLFQGIQAVLRQFRGVGKQLSLEVITAKGEPFDPSLHEAMRTANTGKVDPGTVVAVVRRGYQFNGKLLRPATVIVEAQRDD